MSRAPRRSEVLAERLGLGYDQLVGLRFATNVFLAGTIVWASLRALSDKNPIWAIASMLAASDPEPREARRLFASRLLNVVIGCTVGFGLLVFGSESEWLIPLALAIAVLVSSYVVRVKTMWRQAPITAAVVIAAELTSHSRRAGFEHGLHKVAEVVFGCLVGLLVSLVMSKVWRVRPAAGSGEHEAEAEAAPSPEREAVGGPG